MVYSAYSRPAGICQLLLRVTRYSSWLSAFLLYEAMKVRKHEVSIQRCEERDVIRLRSAGPHESIAKLREHSTKCDQSDVFVGHIVNGFMIAEDIWIPSHQSNRCNGGEH